MRFRLLLIVFLLIASWSSAQQPVAADTVSDSLSIYHKLENLSHKSKVFRFFYRKVFRIPKVYESPKRAEEPVEPYRGRIIRDIRITTLEPFGYSVYDSTVHPHSLVQHGGNFLHNR